MHGPFGVFCVLGEIHHYLPQAASNPAFLHSPTESVVSISVRKHALEETRCAGLEHLRDANTCCSISILGGEVPLQDPDPFAEPADELEVIRCAAQECLSSVHVRGD